MDKIWQSIVYLNAKFQLKIPSRLAKIDKSRRGGVIFLTHTVYAVFLQFSLCKLTSVKCMNRTLEPYLVVFQISQLVPTASNDHPGYGSWSVCRRGFRQTHRQMDDVSSEQSRTRLGVRPSTPDPSGALRVVSPDVTVEMGV